MNNSVLLIALGIATIADLLLGVYSDFGLRVARNFYEFSDGSNRFF